MAVKMKEMPLADEYLKPWGYAWGSGKYMNTCKGCGEKFAGAKLSPFCFDCAYLRYKQYLYQNKKPQIFPK